MWKCEFCGSDNGMYYRDGQLEGMLCLAGDCGRFNEVKDEDIEDSDF